MTEAEIAEALADPARAADALAQIAAAAEEKSLFRDKPRLLAIAESVYRERAPNLIENPEHQCMRTRTCTAVPITLVIYRIPAPAATAAGAAGGGHPSRAGGTGGAGLAIVVAPTGAAAPQSAMDALVAPFVGGDVHVCVEEVCEHLQCGVRARPSGWAEGPRSESTALVAACALGDACPHGRAYAPADRWHFEHVYACSVSGNVHACGEMCKMRHTQITNSGWHICPLTGENLGAVRAPAFEFAEPYAGLGSGDPDSAAVRRGAAPHLRFAMNEAENLAATRTVLRALLVSRERRVMEVDAAHRAISRALEDATRPLRRKKPRPNMRLPVMLYAWWTLAREMPALRYFRYFGVPDEVQPVLATRAREFARTMYGADAVRAETRARVAANVARMRELYPPPTIPPPPSGTRPPEEWIEIGARCAVKAYQNLLEHSRLYADVSFPPFGVLMLPLLYMMQTGYEAPAQPATAGAEDRVCRVPLIPYIPIMLLLPLEAALPLFPAITPHVSFTRHISHVRSDIMRMYQAIHAAGMIHRVEINLRDHLS